MTRPPFEVADIIRQYGARFIEAHRAWLTAQHRRVLRAIAHCRTAALGGHVDRCAACGHRAISFNSCRNRHCPKCLTHTRDQWLAERQRELLPVGYAHVVFTRKRQRLCSNGSIGSDPAKRHHLPHARSWAGSR